MLAQVSQEVVSHVACGDPMEALNSNEEVSTVPQIALKALPHYIDLSERALSNLSQWDLSLLHQ